MYEDLSELFDDFEGMSGQEVYELISAFRDIEAYLMDWDGDNPFPHLEGFLMGEGDDDEGAVDDDSFDHFFADLPDFDLED